MNTAAFVPVDQVIATAASLREGADHIDRAYIKEWIWLGLKEIGPTLAWYNEARLYPTEFALQKPQDYYDAIDLALFTESDSELRYTYRGKGTRIHNSENSLLDGAPYAPEMGAPIDLSEDQYYFHLGSNGSAVNYAILKYWKFPTDENGDMLIPEQFVLGLAIFCVYMFAFRKDDKVGIGQFHNLWVAKRNELRAEANMPSGIDITELARSWNSMIKKTRFKNF